MEVLFVWHPHFHVFLQTQHKIASTGYDNAALCSEVNEEWQRVHIDPSRLSVIRRASILDGLNA